MLPVAATSEHLRYTYGYSNNGRTKDSLRGIEYHDIEHYGGGVY
jgi:hypothetical protein